MTANSAAGEVAENDHFPALARREQATRQVGEAMRRVAAQGRLVDAVGDRSQATNSTASPTVSGSRGTRLRPLSGIEEMPPVRVRPSSRRRASS